VENGVKSGGKSPGYFLLITYHPTTLILFFLDVFPTCSCPPTITGATAIDLCWLIYRAAEPVNRILWPVFTRFRLVFVMSPTVSTVGFVSLLKFVVYPL
jgi:hypothetical protein